MTKLLLTGGAGYLGTSFLRHHKGVYDITVFDNLSQGGDALIPYFRDVNFHFIKGDVRDGRELEDAVKGKDVIVHLAAIVGAPLCDADKKIAYDVNYGGTSNLASATTNSSQHIVYSSTVSVYGKVEKGICTEETEARPLSQYGRTKLLAENLLSWKSCTTFRFPTLFGVAPRMRTDLMVNDLTYRAVKEGSIVVFEPEVRRTFLHVKDAVRAIEMAIDQHLTQVYIPGDEELNVTKRKLAELISVETRAWYNLSSVGHDVDGRDYEVSFEKIKKLGYRASVSLVQGIREVAQAAHVMNVRNPYSNV